MLLLLLRVATVHANIPLYYFFLVLFFVCLCFIVTLISSLVALFIILFL